MVWKWTKRIGFGIVGTIAALALAGALFQTISTKIDESKYPPVGLMVDVGGYKLHLNCQGPENSDKPTVILEAALGSSSLDWSLVKPDVEKFARVCSYDRAGYGWSDESPKERSIANMADELHTLLKNADIPGPYILVGHSLGGKIVRYYASLYPNDVAGVLLVDSSHENQRTRFPESTKVRPNKTLSTLLSRIGVVRAFVTLSRGKNSSMPEEVQKMMQAHRSSTKTTRTGIDEILAMEKSDEQLKAVGGILGDKPLIVLTRGKDIKSEETIISDGDLKVINQLWGEFQKDLVGKSINSKQIFANNSGHMIPYEEPDKIVKAIQDLLSQVSISKKPSSVEED